MTRPTTQHELERYQRLFASRTQGMKSSAMRDMMEVTQRPEVISLAGGNPDLSTFPPGAFTAAMERIGSNLLEKALQYGPTEGLDLAKESIARVMAAEGMEVGPDDILVTTGGQQALDLVCRVLLDPGDVVITEAPTYPGAVPTFATYEADVVQIELDGDGMVIDELEATLARLDAEGRRPKFIYTIPTFHNPAGVTMSAERRARLVAIARERELLVVEDNPYGLLRFEGEPLPTLRALDGGEYVIYLGTFSKILSAGLRLGWIVAPRPLLAKLNVGKAAADLCSSSLTQFFVAEFFAEGGWQRYLDGLVDLYRGRRDTMVAALERYFPPEARWTVPAGGLFVWVTLPETIDTTDLLARALRENVAFVPGRAAFLDGRGGSSMRLNFSGASDEEITEGVRRIGRVIDEQLELLNTLSGQAPRPQRAPRAGADGGDVLPLRRRSA